MHTQKNIDSITKVLADIPLLLTRISEQKDRGEPVLSLPEKYQRLTNVIEEVVEVYVLTGQWDQAVHLSQFVLEMADKAENNGKSGARVRILLGNLLRRRGGFGEALELLQEAKQLAEQALDDRTLGDAIYYLGDLYYIEAFYMHKRGRNEALEFHNEAIRVANKIGYQRGLDRPITRRTHLVMGGLYLGCGEQDDAKEQFRKAAELAASVGYEGFRSAAEKSIIELENKD